MTAPQRFWIAVASADHARIGGSQGFMQVCHGKGGPLMRLRTGDGVVYYSPATTMGGNDGLKSFTTIGRIRDDALYQVEMAPGFVPFRRNVEYRTAKPAPIQPLLDRLDLTRGRKNWGYAFRLGLLEISEHDFRIISEAMGAAA